MLLYSATPPKLKALEDAGRVVRWRPYGDEELAVCREIWMPPALAAAVNADPWPSLPDEASTRTARRRLETLSLMVAFLRGDVMTVGSGQDRVDIKVISPQPGHDWRSWELRATVQQPHTRLFGTFVTEVDFLATEMAPKAKLKTTQMQNAVASRSFQKSTVLVGAGVKTSKAKPSHLFLGGMSKNYDGPDL